MSDADLAPMRRIDELHLDYPFAGSRMPAGLLRQGGHEVGRLHVPTFDEADGDRGDLPASGGDAQRWLYVAAIKDMAIREIVGWGGRPQGDDRSYACGAPRAQLCCDALTTALGRRNPTQRPVHRSDRGSQYADEKYRTLIGKAEIAQFMSRTGECLDNERPLERLAASLEKELVHQQTFRSRAQAKAAIFEYIEVFYNRQTRHAASGDVTPEQAFQDMTWKTAA